MKPSYIEALRMATDSAWIRTVISVLRALLIANGPGATTLWDLERMFERETGMPIPRFWFPNVDALMQASGQFVVILAPGQATAYTASPNDASAHIVKFINDEQ